MTTLVDQVTLDKFILQLMQIPPHKVRIEQLRDVVAQLELDEALLKSCISFDSETYTRSVLCRTLQFDMHLLCWKPGQGTSIHHHAEALNITRVWDGVLTSRLFDTSDSPKLGRPSVQLKLEEQLGRNELTAVDRGELHQLVNTSDHELITLHVYVPPLKKLTIYHPHSNQYKQIRLKYTVEDEAC